MANNAALFFEDAVAERSKEALSTNINFTYGWIVLFNEDRRVLNASFGTNYKLGSCDWNVSLRLRQNPFALTGPAARNRNPSHSTYIMIETARNTKIPGGTCYLQYTVFLDEDMRYEAYTSPRVACQPSPGGFLTEGLRFRSPPGKFLDKMAMSFKEHTNRKVLINIELTLPSRFFLRNFEDSILFSHRKVHEYPLDLEDDFRFKFLQTGDYTIRCPDGSIRADRALLYLSSTFFRTYLLGIQNSEFTSRFNIDVCKPVIWFLHTLCFEMPPTYDLDYIQRLILCIDFFHPINKNDILTTVHRCLCKKVAEDSPDFESLLQMASLSGRYRFIELKNMACSLIANEYYDKFKNTFPEGEQNIQNPHYRDLFQAQHFIGQSPFDVIEKIHRQGFRTNLIL